MKKYEMLRHLVMTNIINWNKLILKMYCELLESNQSEDTTVLVCYNKVLIITIIKVYLHENTETKIILHNYSITTHIGTATLIVIT